MAVASWSPPCTTPATAPVRLQAQGCRHGGTGPPWLEERNAALVDLARRRGALVADVQGHFLGHGVHAGDPTAPDSRPANRDLWYCGLIEPNAWGAHHIRAAWWQAINDSGWRPPR